MAREQHLGERRRRLFCDVGGPWGLCLAVFLASPLAFAQASPPDMPTGNAIPRGAAGAILKPPNPPPRPDAAVTPAGDSMPRALNYQDPVYPPEAYQADLEGQVILKLDISKEGRVLKAAVVEPAGHGFDEAALEAAQKLVFEPARRADGTPFAARIRFRYAFTIRRVPVEVAPQQKTSAVLSGTVSLAGSDAPIAGATVVLGPDNRTTTTDEKGAFVFADLAPGKVTVSIQSPGFPIFSAEEALAAGEETAVKYRLAPKSGGALEVMVRGDRPPREVTKRTLDQREIARIPGTNGDALRSLQNLPGVARPPTIAGVLIVRGSGPQDTQTFIDGTFVPIIYHFGGLSSVVPTELLDKIDFYPGNFGAPYGRVQGGIVDVGLRLPRNEFHGIAQVDGIDARLLLEGPIPGVKGWSFLAAGRRSYVDAWLAPVLRAAGGGVTQAPVYYDYQFMVATRPTPESSFRVAFFGSDDALKLLLDKPLASEPALSGNVGLHTGFMRLQTRYTQDLGGGDRLQAVVAFGRDNLDFGVGSLYLRFDIRSLTGRFEFTKKLARGMLLDAGLDMFGGAWNVNIRFPTPSRPGQPPNGPLSTRLPVEQHLAGGAVQPAAYLELELTPGERARVVPSVRVDYFTLNQTFDVSPRINARFDLRKDFPRSTIKGGAGLYHQPPAFQEVGSVFGNPNLRSNRAVQYALGFEQQLTPNVEASIEGFYKRLGDQVVSSASTTSASLQYTNNGTGYVVGSELLLKYKPDERFFGWLAYTLSRSIRVDGPGQPEHLVSFDQTHILTVLGSYKLGYGWEIGARFRLVSGNLVTPFVCDPQQGSCDPTRTNALFNAAAGTYTAIPFAGQSSERLPLFHQLDIRLDKTWRFKRWQLATYLDVQNAYNHVNVEAIGYNFNYTARSPVTGLPILPSFGLRGEL